MDERKKISARLQKNINLKQQQVGSLMKQTIE
jgi:hypothetical protein